MSILKMSIGYELRRTIRALDELEKRKEEVKTLEANIKLTLAAIQRDCPHVWQFIPDASGGYDNERWCEICGKVED